MTEASISPRLVSINQIPDHDARRAAWTEYYTERIVTWKIEGTVWYKLDRRCASLDKGLGDYVFEKDSARTEALQVLRVACRLSEGERNDR